MARPLIGFNSVGVTLPTWGYGNGSTDSGGGGGASTITSYPIDATAAPVVQNLPAATIVGQLAILIKTDATANGVSAHPSGTDTINGVNADSTPMTIQNDSMLFLCTAVGAWRVVG